MQWHNEGYSISTDKQLLQVSTIHAFLAQSYWAKGIPIETVEKAIQHSLCFGVYQQDKLVGFARVVSDYASFAYLADVFILPEFRGLGLSKWLMECIQAHPDLQGLRRFMLCTADAHGLYEKFGFRLPSKPERIMEVLQADIYSQASICNSA